MCVHVFVTLFPVVCGCERLYEYFKRPVASPDSLAFGRSPVKMSSGANSMYRGTWWNLLKASDLKACFASASTMNSTRASVLVGGSTTRPSVPYLPKRRERSLSVV